MQFVPSIVIAPPSILNISGGAVVCIGEQYLRCGTAQGGDRSFSLDVGNVDSSEIKSDICILHHMPFNRYTFPIVKQMRNYELINCKF